MCFYGIIYLKIERRNFLEKMLSKIFKKVKFLAKRTAAASIVEDRIDTWSK